MLIEYNMLKHYKMKIIETKGHQAINFKHRINCFINYYHICSMKISRVN
jgi:hypothetical protein